MNAQAQMSDEERELEIDRCMRFIVDTENSRDARRAACAAMAALHAQRSPEQVRRMEVAKGLAR